jgi:branched-chain amino acid aminotransferase
VITPGITDDVLEGITRRTILELAQKEMGLPVVERSVDRTEIFLADEMFLCGTGVQVGAVTRVDNRAIGAGRMGPVVTELRRLYFDVVRGRRREYRHWCAPVYSGEKDFAKPEPDRERSKDSPNLRLAR